MHTSIKENRTQLLQRCMARLQEAITIEERIKILRVMASTAQTMSNDLENAEVTITTVLRKQNDYSL
jgi:hypothetical protein